MYLLGQLEHGVYAPSGDDGDWSDEDPSDLARAYGVDDLLRLGSHRQREDDVEMNNILENNLRTAQNMSDRELYQRVRRQLKHTPAKVSRIQDPFADRPDDSKVLFWSVVREAVEKEILPSGYGFLPIEEGYGEWNSVEKIHVGKKRIGREYRVTLPREVWEPRLKLWTQGLEALAYITR